MPPCSPDLQPFWIFFGDYVKDCIYQNPVCDLATFCTSIIEAVKTVDVVILQQVWKEIEYRLNIMRASKGVQFL